jgi:alkylation response protein AidB-like acyl-CoA dehydrogenase
MDNATYENTQCGGRPMSEAARFFELGRACSDFVDTHDSERRGLDEAALRDIWARIGESGLFALGVDESPRKAVSLLQSFGEGCRDNALLLAVSAQIWSIQSIIDAFGSDEHKERYLKPLVAGQAICAHAITEPGSGSDALGATSTAVQSGEGYILNGRKSLIGMAPICDFAIVFASTNPERGSWGLSVFMVAGETAGFLRHEPSRKLGLGTTPSGSLSFENCEVPADALLGREGAGASIFNQSLDLERRFVFAAQVGAMKRQLRDCIAFAKEREVFGSQISQYQSVSNRLANMRVRYETSKLMLEKAALEVEQGAADPTTAAVTKLHLSEAILASSEDALRIYAGHGYMDDHIAGHDIRDALGGVIYGGTSDIQRKIIASLQERDALWMPD